MKPLALSLLLGLCLYANAATAAEAPETPAQARFDKELAALRAAPDGYDYASLWQAFAERADAAASQAALRVLEQFEDSHAPTPEECTRNAAALDEALVLIPVSLALHLTAGACSGDEADAKMHAAAIRGLMQAQERPLLGRVPLQPWRVYTRWDAEALLYALGLEVLNRTMTPGDTLDTLPQIYQVAREGSARSELVYVDFFDLGARISERAGKDLHPLYRFQLLDAYVASGIDEGDALDTSTRAAEAIVDAQGGELSPEAAHTAVLEVREHDRAAIAVWWLTQCMAAANAPGCPTDDVDLLLDDAEAGSPFALIALSLMHALGRGVEVDAERAEGLYRHLREVFDADQASLLTGGTILRLVQEGVAPTALAPVVVADLVKVRKTLPPADAMLAGFAALGIEEARALGKVETLMESSYTAGYGPAGQLAAARWARQPETLAKAVERLRAIERDWSLPPVQLLLGTALLQQGKIAEAEPLLARAARAGLPAAMRGYSLAFLSDPDAERVEAGRALLYVAWHGGDPQALRQLVDSYDGDLPDDRSRLDEALAALEAQAKDGKDPEVALSWGRALILGLGGKPKQREGLRQVRRAQRAGSAQAYLYEYELALAGEIARVDAQERRELLDGALAAGDRASTRAQVGRRLYLDPGSQQAERDRALALMEQAEDAGAPYVLNDLAWELCVAGKGALGLPLAQRASARREESASVIDTLAACEAVSGEHAQAARTQQRALELAGADSEYPAETLAGMRRRLEAYQEGRTAFD